jgi:predicted nucleic acid-binding protein
MTALDTDVLAIYHVFRSDPRHDATKAFLDSIKGHGRGVTVFNLLELCGILSSAQRLEESKSLFERYLKAQNVSILFPDLVAHDARSFWAATVSECLSRIQRGMRFGDAAILWTLESSTNVDAFVTWNTKHFAGKTALKIVTPSDFV